MLIKIFCLQLEVKGSIIVKTTVNISESILEYILLLSYTN
jgi:hypothetical protein